MKIARKYRCKVCQFEYFSYCSNSKYCSEECAREAIKERIRLKIYEPDPVTHRMKKKVNRPQPSMSLAEVTKMARDKVMSYGEFVLHNNI